MYNSSDSSRKISIGNVGGDFNASGSALNLGDISGTVTNSLNQLSASPQMEQFKAHIHELLDALETDEALPAEDKADAAEAVAALTEAAKDENPETQKSLMQKTARSLNRIAKTLPDATKFVRAVNRCVPAIATLFAL